MKIEVPEVYRTIANLKEGEEIVGINAREGEENDMSHLAFRVDGALGIHPVVMSADPEPHVVALRYGWMESGKLWVVYQDADTYFHPASAKLEREFKSEQRKTNDCLLDVIKFLTHNTSKTRRQLVEALRQRAEVIEAEINIDQH